MDDAVETLAALIIGEIIGWVIGGAIWLVGLSLFLSVRSHPSFIGVAAISCGAIILVMVAWRALKAGVKAFDDPGANQLIGERREGKSG
ncbi:hypothetical protein [Bradyrhizobium sp.]|uniref:hypothetical protein n=1 Tax=Bradyrhizobium sp. TaxID=376 RepID=UPI003C34BCB2